MKKMLLITLAICSIGLLANAQEKLDSLFYLNGKIDVVSIVKNTSESIDCTYVGEDMISTIDKSKLHKIVFKSGRVEECNPMESVKEEKLDKIYFANGDVVEGKVVKMGDESIDYTLPGESLAISTFKSLLNKIEFANGRTQEFGNLLKIKVIKSESEWEDVVVTYNVEDTRGLEKVAEISKASGYGGMLASGVGYNDAIKKCQKEAAKMGCGLILVNGSPNARQVHYGAGVRVNATAYRLPKQK